jgi:hypothetical protein
VGAAPMCQGERNKRTRLIARNVYAEFTAQSMGRKFRVPISNLKFAEAIRARKTLPRERAKS